MVVSPASHVSSSHSPLPGLPVPGMVLLLLAFFAQPSATAEPAAERTFDTVAAMCAAAGLTAAAQLRASGYRQPEDGGGGPFRYDPDSTIAADAGSVLELQKMPGRLIRVVDPEEDASAEWFGAYGDGDSATPHDDQDALNKCLAAYGRVKLRAKVYGVRGKPSAWDPKVTYHAVDLGPYYQIIGSGREQTTIKLLEGTNPAGGGPGDNYFILLSNRAFHESAEHTVVSDLTLDCNFDRQDKHTTIHALGIRGGGALVERVNFRGYGTGCHPETGNSRECFVIHQTLVYKDRGSCRRAAVYRDLDFTGCGHNGMLDGKVGEITHICLGGADNFENKGWILPKGADPDFDPANDGENENNWWPSYGGLVENCVIHDEVYDLATQKSPLNGITYGDCVGLTVRGNRVENFEGSAVFTMSWWNRDTTIVDNQFLGVTNGVALNMASADAKPLQCPRHEAVLIAHNNIVLGSHTHAPWGTCGVSLFGGDMPAVPRMVGIHVRSANQCKETDTT
ncbi:MAG: hypothetical protein AUJ96_10840 [Armatimonadetes bacterium CG2_30_66_41]|nr:hypothetical protein [Armatimonadota bacterium]OIP05439.1 MAG: hypothetical protein AUJ96_10840 [Armatimonadetes bacterium CG2_30_66_41]NCO94535.1 hypothetical protein [Armatimonadota bacterium]NCP29857.1 hypothetical protein [Armatimonadota bacterium]NCQ27929.1 hypothetical protein [Armatimonadota bacterium]